MYQQTNPKLRSTNFTISSIQPTIQDSNIFDKTIHHYHQDQDHHGLLRNQYQHSTDKYSKDQQLSCRKYQLNPFMSANQKISKQSQQVQAFITTCLRNRKVQVQKNYKDNENREQSNLYAQQNQRQKNVNLVQKRHNYFSNFKIKKIKDLRPQQRSYRDSRNSQQKVYYNEDSQNLHKKQIKNKNPHFDPSTVLKNIYNKQYKASLSYQAQTNTKVIHASQNPEEMKNTYLQTSNKKSISSLFLKKLPVKQLLPQKNKVYENYTHTLKNNKFSKSISQISHQIMVQQYVNILKKSVKKETSPQIINSVFHLMFQNMKITIPSNPLIRQYRNGIYFGQNRNIIQNSSYEGVLIYYDNKIYYGGFLNQKRYGKGVEIQFNLYNQMTKVLKGCFSSDPKEKFILITPAYFYHGMILNGKMNGFGKLTTNMSIYEGQFLNDMRHGFGKQIFTSGLILEGQFNENKFNDICKKIQTKNVLRQSKNLRIKKYAGHLIDFNYQYVDQNLKN